MRTKYLRATSSKVSALSGPGLGEDDAVTAVQVVGGKVEHGGGHLQELVLDLLAGLLDRGPGHEGLAAGVGPEVDGGGLGVRGDDLHLLVAVAHGLGRHLAEHRVRALADVGGPGVEGGRGAVLVHLDDGRGMGQVGAVDGITGAGDEAPGGNPDAPAAGAVCPSSRPSPTSPAPVPGRPSSRRN